VARDLFSRRDIVSSDLFPLIYWEGMAQVMKAFSQMFWMWITKHVAHFNGSFRQLSRWDKLVINWCPNCGYHNETTPHINRCPDAGRRQVMKESVKELDKWLKREQTDRDLHMLICKYINAHGDKTMVSLLSSQSSKYKTAMVLHNRLGWSNFMGDRISSMWVEHVNDDIRRRNLSKSGPKWARGLMTQLMQMTHQQWSYRNATVHLKVKDGCTTAEHNKALNSFTPIRAPAGTKNSTPNTTNPQTSPPRWCRLPLLRHGIFGYAQSNVGDLF
jgi:hypothetical protein